jgi:FKBP-type peptidyl-prolyl cis-trans isomerase SlyD
MQRLFFGHCPPRRVLSREHFNHPKDNPMSARVISFHYTLTDSAGKELDSSAGSEPLTFMEGAGQIIPGLERHLLALKLGEKKRVTVKAKDAYGEKDATNIVEMPLEKMPAKGIKVGDQFRAGKDAHAPVVTATKITDTHVTLDGNHPLAGKDLTFAVEITAIRAATADEVAHGHAHGPGGHHH